MPQWGSGPAVDNGGLASVGLGSNDALAFTQFRNTAISAGLDVPIPLFFVCLAVEASAATDNSDSNTQMVLEDIDGDGLPDQVFKKNDLTGGSSSTTVYAKLNPSGMANLLTHVDGPLGGSFDIEYGRAGNEVNIPAHIDDPTNHWVMTAATIHRQGTVGGLPSWNADPDQRSEYAYAGGFYSRADRDFVGFKTITTTIVGEQSTVEETFDTSDVYHKGNLLKRVVRDKAGKVFEVEERQYDTRVLQAVSNAVLEPRAVKFVPEVLRRFRTYEGGGTNPDAATLTREEARDYENTFGSETSYEDRGDTAVTTDDVKYTIGYYQDTAKHIIKPNLIVAKDAAGNVLSQRSATYLAANGKMDSLTDLLKGGRDANGVTYTGGAATNPTWFFGYNELGSLQSTTDPNGYTVAVLQFDNQVRTYPVVLNDPFNYIWVQHFDRLTGELEDRTDLNETTTFIGHDVHRRPISVAIGTASSLRASVGYAAAAADQSTPALALVAYTNPEVSETLAMVDGWGRPIQTKKRAVIDDGSGNPVAGVIVSGRRAFDSRGRLVSAGQPFFRAGQDPSSSLAFDNAAATNPTTFAYDVLSRQTKVTPPPGGGITTTATTAYDLFTLAGSLRRRQTATDLNGQILTTYADARNRPVQVDQRNTIGGLLKVLSTKYDYDQLDRLRHVIDAKNNTTTVDWDTMGRMIDQINPDTGKTIYDHDLGGNVVRKQNANGQVNQYVYTLNRLEHVFYPSGTAVHLTYGPPGASPDYGAGRVVTRVDETGTDTFKYDPLGNIVQTVWAPVPVVPGGPAPASYTTTYTYDAVLSTLRSVAVGGETVTYGYDVTGQVNQVTGQRGSTQTAYASKILYNELGQRTRIELGNGAITKYVYEPVLRRLKNVNTDAGGIAVQRLVYGYDSVNNVTSLANAVPATPTTVPAGAVLPGPTSQTFGYDNLYQLTSASGLYTGVGARGGRSYTLAMTYDEIGNIKSKNQKDTIVATVGGMPQTQPATTFNVAYTYGSTRPHAATAIGAQTSTFDLDGNQTSAHGSFGIGRDMTYNEEDRLKTDIQAGVTSTFLYHPTGARAIKRDTTSTYYPNAHLVDRPGARSTRQIMIGNQRIASVLSSTNGVINTFYYHSDQLQSSSYMTNGGGLLLQHDEYMPSGQTWVEEVRNGDKANNRTSFLFNAKELDDTGLYYFGGRYYDPVASQWLTPDPILHRYLGGVPNGGAFNPKNMSLYSYAYNSPLTVRDPSGLSPEAPDKGSRSRVVLDEITILGEVPKPPAPPPARAAPAPAPPSVAPNDGTGGAPNVHEIQIWQRPPHLGGVVPEALGSVGWYGLGYGHMWLYHPASGTERGMLAARGTPGGWGKPTTMQEHHGAHRDAEALMTGKVYVDDPGAVLDALRIDTPTGDWYVFYNDCHTAAHNALQNALQDTPPPTSVENNGLNNGTF